MRIASRVLPSSEDLQWLRKQAVSAVVSKRLGERRRIILRAAEGRAIFLLLMEKMPVPFHLSRTVRPGEFTFSIAILSGAGITRKPWVAGIPSRPTTTAI
jgi:hypothetical protein